MGLLRRKVPSHLVPIDRHNTANKDWIILLEAGTIVGPSPDRLRVARATTERKIVRKYNLFLRAQHYLVVEDYDPRIHALYFCPQLYRYDADNRLVPMHGDEIGKLIAQSLEDAVVDRQPWYKPLDKLPEKPVISADMRADFETVVVELPSRPGGARPSAISHQPD